MGYCYFIAQGNKVKIGYSKNPRQRIKILSTSSPLPLVLLGYLEGSKEIERDLQHNFHKYHMQLEWFELNLEIIDFINENTITNTYCELDNGLVRVYRKMKI